MSERERDTKVAQFWDGNAEAWADGVRSGRDTINDTVNMPSFLRFVGDVDGKKVLDAGCGEGRSSRHFACKGAKVTGIDISARMLELALRQETREPLGIDYRQISMSDLSMLEDGAFDAVVSFMALMDAPDFDGAVGEFARVLGPGGQLAFMVRHPCFFTRGFAILQGRQGSRARLSVSDYFDENGYVERWRFSDPGDQRFGDAFAVPRFPRILSRYINGVLEAGFVLTGIVETRPTTEDVQRHPPFAFWARHAALCLGVRARRQ